MPILNPATTPSLGTGAAQPNMINPMTDADWMPAGANDTQSYLNTVLGQGSSPTERQINQVYQMSQAEGLTPEQLVAMSGGQYTVDDVARTTAEIQGNEQNFQNYISNAMGQEGGPTYEQAQYANQVAQARGYSAEDLAGMSGGQYDAQTIANSMGELGTPAPFLTEEQNNKKYAAPVSYGSGPAEAAVRQGLSGAMNSLGRTRNEVNQGFQGASNKLNRYYEPGYRANDKQAALSGALGPEAQRQAFQNFQDSPGQAFLQEQGERALTRNAARLGGLGGGNVRQELVKFGQGLAAQDLQNQFGRLGDVATRGLSSATTMGGMEGQRAGIMANLGQYEAGLQSNTGFRVGDIRQQAGRDLAQYTDRTTSALADLMNQQGSGQADIFGAGAANIGNLINAAMGGDSNAIAQLGTTLSNQAVQAGSQYAGQGVTPYATTNMLGSMGNLMSGIGAGVGSLPVNTPAPVSTSTPIINTYGAGPYQSS